MSTPEKRTKVMRWFSLGRTVGWIVVGGASYAAGLWQNVAFVTFLSLWALVETAFAAWRSDENPDAARMARIEKKLDQMAAQR